MPDDEPFDYLPTQAIADFLAANANSRLDGILYQSVQGGEGELNVVLFRKASRIQMLDLPKATGIVARIYASEDDESETEYWVSETVPELPATPADTQLPPSFFDSLPLEVLSAAVAIEEYDVRDVTLKLDVSSLQVHHVRTVKYKTESYSVGRYRSDKRESTL